MSRPRLIEADSRRDGCCRRAFGELQKKLPAGSGESLAGSWPPRCPESGRTEAGGAKRREARNEEIAQPQEAVAKIAAGVALPPQTAVAPAAARRSCTPVKTADGLRYRDQPPAEPQPPGLDQVVRSVTKNIASSSDAENSLTGIRHQTLEGTGSH